MGEKKLLSIEELASQSALELPERETLDTVVLSCVAVCIGQIRFRDVNAAVANNICANVGAIANALNVALLAIQGAPQGIVLSCDTRGGNQGG